MVSNLDLEFQGMLLRTSGIEEERPEGGGGMNQLRASGSGDLCSEKANRFRETEVKKKKLIQGNTANLYYVFLTVEAGNSTLDKYSINNIYKNLLITESGISLSNIKNFKKYFSQLVVDLFFFF